jgi:hypothetical protein
VNVRDAITKLLREQSDRTNLIEALWLIFAASVKIPTGGVQWIESRRCFFAGALTTFEALMMIMEDGHEPTDADEARVDKIAKELTRFADELKVGIG